MEVFLALLTEMNVYAKLGLSFMTDQESFFVEGRDLDSVIFIANWYSRAINSFLPIIVLAIEISNEA